VTEHGLEIAEHGAFVCYLSNKREIELRGNIERPDYVVILAWQYSETIMGRHRRFLEEGGSFVIPLPELKVVHK